MRKIKSIKKAALVFMIVLLAGTFSGCGKSVNAPQCLKAHLDNVLKGDTKAVVELNLALSESAAADAYEESIDARLDALFSSFNISKELKNDFYEVLSEISANTKYEVGGFTEKEDGSCIVTVTYEQLQIFEPAMEDALAAYEKVFRGWKDDPSSAAQTDAEMEEQFFTLLRGSVRKMLVNAKYAEPAETTITLVKAADQCYVPVKQDLDDLTSKFFDQLDTDKMPSFDITDIYDFDASKYLQALLDLSYKNDSTLFIQVTDYSANEAAIIYELGMASEVRDFELVLGSNISDELLVDYKTLIKEMFSKVRYTVGDAKRQEDGSYIVKVTYEQMKVFEPMLEAVADKLAVWVDNPALIPDSDEEITKQLLIVERDCLYKALSDLEYKEAEEMTITLIPDGESYIVDPDDSAMLGRNLFDSESIFGDAYGPQ